MNINKYTYVFGHKNPDTDSICGAIALSYLRNQMGYLTIPAALGELNNETRYALSYFNVKHPFHLNDVKLQLKDVAYHKGCFIDKNLSIKDAFDYMNKYSLTGIPVVENKNKYFGYVAWGLVIAAWALGLYIWHLIFGKAKAIIKPFNVCPRCGHTYADKRTALGLLKVFQPWKWI